MDYYKVLGVSRESSADEIRKAYRKLSRDNHPDRKPGDKQAEETFKQVQQAYDVLGDPEKREQYDRYGSAFQNMGTGPNPRGRSGGHQSGPVDFESMFGQGGFGGSGFSFDLEDIFGPGASRKGAAERTGRRPAKGQDIKTDMSVPFHLAARGGTYELALDKGQGVERLDVKIPAGLNDGSTIRLAGQGALGQGGASPGDLLVTIHIAPHPYFKREGNNLILEAPISIIEATLGAKIDVPTLDEGTVVVSVPPGTSSGARLRLKGKGILDRQTKQAGDQLIALKIVAPKSLPDNAIELLKSFEQLVPQHPRETLWK